eukprot:14057804-Alexandrium_andersonii.AAC.1
MTPHATSESTPSTMRLPMPCVRAACSSVRLTMRSSCKLMRRRCRQRMRCTSLKWRPRIA